MPKFQVWLRGSDLHDITAKSEKDALEQVRNFYGYKKLPKGTSAIEIPYNYYDGMVKNNQSIGINAGNM